MPQIMKHLRVIYQTHPVTGFPQVILTPCLWLQGSIRVAYCLPVPLWARAVDFSSAPWLGIHTWQSQNHDWRKIRALTLVTAKIFTLEGFIYSSHGNGPELITRALQRKLRDWHHPMLSTTPCPQSLWMLVEDQTEPKCKDKIDGEPK